MAVWRPGAVVLGVGCATGEGRPRTDVNGRRPYGPSSEGGGTGPIWSRDGRTLYYAEGSRMMRVAITASPRFAAGTPERYFESAEFVWDRPSNYEVLSDDCTFVMIRRSRARSAERRLRVVFDWFSELERLVPTK